MMQLDHRACVIQGDMRHVKDQALTAEDIRQLDQAILLGPIPLAYLHAALINLAEEKERNSKLADRQVCEQTETCMGCGYSNTRVHYVGCRHWNYQRQNQGPTPNG